ncbi:MAG: TonB-dependent receptor plug domain-containing protein [Polyangiaceae bacterium]
MSSLREVVRRALTAGIVLSAASARISSAETLIPAALEPGDVAIVGIRPRRDTSEQKLTAEDARAQPGTHDDPAKAIENLPGFARAAFGSDQLLLWGAAPEDSRVYVDGVEIPQLFHGSGIRSTINGNLLQSVSLSPGAYGADYGRAIGGMVRLETREITDGYHATVDASTLDASALLSGRVSDRVRLALAARYGLLDRTLNAVDAADIGEFVAVPRYHDYQAKLQIALRTRESLDVVLLASSDALDRLVSNSDPARVRSLSTSQSFERVYLRYRLALDDGGSVEIVPWLGRDSSRNDAHFGDVPAQLEQRTTRFGLRAEHRSRLSSRVVLRLGLDASGAVTELARRGSLTLPAREGDLTVFGQTPADDDSADSWGGAIVDVAPYATVDWDNGPLTLSPALRLDGYLLESSRQTPRVGQTPAIGRSALDAEVQPRISARYRLSERVALLAAAGFYSQPPAAQDSSAVFGTPTLAPEAAAHATFGESVALTRALSVHVTAFYRALSSLVGRDPSATPKLASSLLQTGSGRSYGVQIQLTHKPLRGFSGSLAYTLSRSERRASARSELRLFDYDEPHVLTVQVRQSMGGWAFGLRFRYASGAPRTPVIGAIYDETGDAYQPTLGAQNSERLPVFWQFDVRADHKFQLAEHARLTAYAELINATNRANAEEFAYSQNYSRRGLITGLPLVGVLGARLEL